MGTMPFLSTLGTITYLCCVNYQCTPKLLYVTILPTESKVSRDFIRYHSRAVLCYINLIIYSQLSDMKSNYVQVSLTNYMIPVDFEVPSNHQREAEDSCMISKLIYRYCIHVCYAISTYSPINLIDFYTGNIIFAWAVYVRKHWAYGHSRGKHLNRFSVQEMVVTR